MLLFVGVSDSCSRVDLGDGVDKFDDCDPDGSDDDEI